AHTTGHSSGTIGGLHLAYQFWLVPFEDDVALLLHFFRSVLARRERGKEGTRTQAIDATDQHRGRRELAARKRRWAQLTRVLLGRAVRVAERLEADVLDNLLTEGLRQSRDVDRLADVTQEIGNEQAVALAAGQRVERIACAGQHPLQVRGQPTQPGEGALLQCVRRRLAREITACQLKERGAERARHPGICEQVVELAPTTLLRLRTERGRHARPRGRRWADMIVFRLRIRLLNWARRGAVVNIYVALAIDLDIDPATGIFSRTVRCWLGVFTCFHGLLPIKGSDNVMQLSLYF